LTVESVVESAEEVLAEPESSELDETEATTSATSDKPADDDDASASSSPAEEEVGAESEAEPVPVSIAGGGFNSPFIEAPPEKTMVERINELEVRIAALEAS
jgi:hypothetical protein